MTSPRATGRSRCMAAATTTTVTFALLALAHSPAAWAGPEDYVATPTVEQGEFEVDFKFGKARLADGSKLDAKSLGLGYGVNSWWFTEVYAKWHGDSASGHSFDAFEWENRFQLTETGKYPVDLGWLVEIERPRDRSEGYELRWGPLLQAELGAWQGNLNLLVEKHYQASTAAPAELGYQWQVHAPVMDGLEAGVQGYGNFGRWDRFAAHNDQEHRIGPALYGKVKVGAHQAVKWNAAWLQGLTPASPRQGLRLQAEWEM